MSLQGFPTNVIRFPNWGNIGMKIVEWYYMQKDNIASTQYPNDFYLSNRESEGAAIFFSCQI